MNTENITEEETEQVEVSETTEEVARLDRNWKLLKKRLKQKLLKVSIPLRKKWKKRTEEDDDDDDE